MVESSAPGSHSSGESVGALRRSRAAWFSLALLLLLLVGFLPLLVHAHQLLPAVAESAALERRAPRALPGDSWFLSLAETIAVGAERQRRETERSVLRTATDTVTSGEARSAAPEKVHSGCRRRRWWRFPRWRIHPPDVERPPREGGSRPSDGDLSLLLYRAVLTLRLAPVGDWEARLFALSTVRELCHDLKRSQTLLELGGIVAVASALDDAHPRVRAAAAQVLGVASQNNPRMHSAVAPFANALMRRSADRREDIHVRSACLFAVLASMPADHIRRVELDPVSALRSIADALQMRLRQLPPEPSVSQAAHRYIRRALVMGRVLLEREDAARRWHRRRHRRLGSRCPRPLWRPLMRQHQLREQAAALLVSEALDGDARLEVANFLRALSRSDDTAQHTAG
ncbi:hypothetical protein CDCA_CDCA06G1957 [Cyanidium caldarium]|uniref:TOG domain-containing protein n=1 Tax=Cyanidium caldarium TaxID=2771 RepID=A0AAV9IUD2_CYACA|nr:hypothetical protein CDCA_CDCA06G1957 [Cyanidium caldarium]